MRTQLRLFLLFILLALGGGISQVHAQDWAIKTNIISDATATVNLGAEIGIAPKWSVDISGSYNGWSKNESVKWKHVLIQHIMANTEIGKTTIEELQVMMHRKISDDGTAYRDEDLLPLYHGLMEIDINDVDGKYRHTMSMVKNTNVVRILLHEMSGHPMSAEQYSFEITDRNGLYDYDNTRLDDEVITYKPWHMESIYAESETTRATEINAVLAELTLGRMSAASSPILCVRNTETGEEVLRIPIADYALLVKGHYRESMGDQEYLDRQDEYPMTLFLDEGEWVSSQIIINGWRVVINNTELN